MAYPGGKAQPGVFQTLINQIPPHAVFISACLGDCAVLLNKRPAARSIGIDLDPAPLERWRLRGFPGLELYQTTAQAFLRAFFSLETWPPAPKHAQKPLGAFVYADPPYPMSTRSGRKLYRHEMTDAQHADLCAVLAALPCPVMVSTYPNAIYAAAFTGWSTLEYDAMTRGATKRRELVYMNYPAPVALHDYAWAGAEKRERERIRRRVRNWLRLLDDMDPTERGAVLQAIADHYHA